MGKLAICAAFAMILLAAGCQRSRLFPHAEGSKWTYSVVTPYLSTIESAQIRRGAPVGDDPGFLLQGPNQSCRMGWRGPILKLAAAGSTTFHPPLPMMDASKRETEMEWKGQVIVAGDPEPGHATISQAPSEATAAGRTFKTVRSVVTLDYGAQTLTLSTDWADEVGIVKQEQRLDDKLVVRIEWMNGPRTQN